VDRVMERAAEQAAVEDKKRQPNQMWPGWREGQQSKRTLEKIYLW
jgi:hypothetical protein